MTHPLQKAVDVAAIGTGLTAPWWVKLQFWAELTTPMLGWLAAFLAVLLAAGRLWAWARGYFRNSERDS